MKNRIRCLLLLIASAASLSAPAAQPAHTTRIEPQRNEHWWGCNADGHTPQPLAAPLDEEAGILTDSTEFLLSSTGRYLWSAHPFTVAIDDDGTFIITSDYEAVQAAKGGRTLREAYLYCVHKHIRPAVADSKHSPSRPRSTMPARRLSPPRSPTWAPCCCRTAGRPCRTCPIRPC